MGGRQTGMEAGGRAAWLMGARACRRLVPPRAGLSQDWKRRLSSAAQHSTTRSSTRRARPGSPPARTTLGTGGSA